MWGLWTEHFPFALVWRANGNTNKRPFPSRAPTWSWISIDGRVRAAARSTFYEIIVFCEVVKSNTCVGAVDHWVITLQCKRLLEIANIEMNVERKDLAMCTVYLPHAVKPNHNDVDLHLDDNGRDHSNPAERSYLMCVYVQDEYEESGLVVQAVKGRKGCFERLGVYRTYFTACAKFTKERDFLASDDELLLYEDKCAKQEGKEQMYLISLI